MHSASENISFHKNYIEKIHRSRETNGFYTVEKYGILDIYVFCRERGKWSRDTTAENFESNFAEMSIFLIKIVYPYSLGYYYNGIHT